MDPQFDGMIFKTHGAELRRRLRFPFPPFRVLDVRPREDYERGHIAGAVSVAPAAAAADLPAGRVEVFVVGRGPGDPAVREASLALLRHGAHRVVEFEGGMFEWELGGYPLGNGALEGGPVEGGRAAA